MFFVFNKKAKVVSVDVLFTCCINRASCESYVLCHMTLCLMSHCREGEIGGVRQV